MSSYSEHEASEVIRELCSVIFGMALFGADSSHNGKPCADIAGELYAAENIAEVRAALGLPAEPARARQ